MKTNQSTQGYNVVVSKITHPMNSYNVDSGILVEDRFDMEGNRITDLGDPTIDSDAVNLQYLNDNSPVQIDTIAEVSTLSYPLIFVKETNTFYKLVTTFSTDVDNLNIINGDGGQYIAVAGKYKDNSAFSEYTTNLTGFIDSSEAVTSWTNATRTFVIAPVSDYFRVFVKGVYRIISTSLSVQIPIDTDSGTIYFYIDTDFTLKASYSDTTNISAIMTKAVCGIIYWNKTLLSAQIISSNERHTTKISGFEHVYKHSFLGTQYATGLGLTNFTIGTGSSNDDWKYRCASGLIYDEDIRLSISEVLTTGQIPVLYRLGTEWTKDTTYDRVVNGGSGRLMYNQNGTTLTEVTNNDFMLMFVIATNDTDFPVMAITGQQQYSNIYDLRNNAPNEINSLITNGLPVEEFIFVGAIAYQTNNSYTNSTKSRIVRIDGADYLDYRTAKTISIRASVTDHGSLSGLTDDDHSQYALLAGRSGDILTIDGIKAYGSAGGTLKNSSGANCLTWGAGGGCNVSTTDGLSVAGTLMVDTIDVRSADFLTINDDVLINGGITATGNIEGAAVYSNYFYEQTPDAGILLDGVRLKDGGGTFTDDINADTIGTTGATSFNIKTNGTDKISVTSDGVVSMHNQIASRAFLNTAQSIPNDNITTLICNQEDYDNQSNYNTTTGVFTVPVTGRYSVKGAIAFNQNTTGARYLFISLNGTILTGASTDAVSDAAAYTYLSVSDTFKLSIGDVITIRCLQTSGVNLLAVSTNTAFAVDFLG